jgi:D-alanyl-D-alanine carboxypeptidase (penicillin-binding protein 5/6)
MVPKDVSAEDLTVIPVLFSSSVEAPVEKGQVLGQVTVSYRDKVYGTVDLVAVSEVVRDEWMYRKDCLDRLLDSIRVKIVLVILAVLLVLLVILRLFVGRRNRRRRTYRARRYRGRR